METLAPCQTSPRGLGWHARALLFLAVIFLAAPDSVSAQNGSDPNLNIFLKARDYYDKGNFPLAVREHRRFLKAAPKHPRVPDSKWGLGLAYIQLKQWASHKSEKREQDQQIQKISKEFFPGHDQFAQEFQAFLADPFQTPPKDLKSWQGDAVKFVGEIEQCNQELHERSQNIPWEYLKMLGKSIRHLTQKTDDGSKNVLNMCDKTAKDLAGVLLNAPSMLSDSISPYMAAVTNEVQNICNVVYQENEYDFPEKDRERFENIIGLFNQVPQLPLEDSNYISSLSINTNINLYCFCVHKLLLQSEKITEEPATEKEEEIQKVA